MTAFSEFDPREPLSEGRTVIEASAGTGKTFAISALVTRLIAEEDVPLEEILVVTFTRAATAELRARVRDRILMTLRALVSIHPPSGRVARIARFGRGGRAVFGQRWRPPSCVASLRVLPRGRTKNGWW